MIRLVFPLRRRSDIELPDFHEYWLRRHGPLVASHREALGIVRYVQTHRKEHPVLDGWLSRLGVGMESPHDGVAELWYPSEEAMLAGGSSSRARDAALELLEDERRFIDLANSPLWLAAEGPGPDRGRVVLAADSSLRVTCFLRPSSDVAEDEARDRWTGEPGPLVATERPGFSGVEYRRVVRVESAVERGLRRARGTDTEAYLGHEEMWLRRDAPIGERRLEADHAVWSETAAWIDLARSSVWSGTEHVIIEGA